jgi:sugar lactone lactonase YvrE
MKKPPLNLLPITITALLAALLAPAVACADTLFVSNYGADTIEMFTSGGVGSIFASTGLSSPTGLAFDSAGNLYAANSGNNTIEKFSSTGTDLGVFASTGLSIPLGLAFDGAGNLYAANFGNNTIEKFTPGGVGSVFAHNVAGSLFGPAGLAFDSAGNLFVANGNNADIEKFTPGGVGSVFAFGFSTGGNPRGLAFDGAGNLYAAIIPGGGIDKITPGGGVSNFASSGVMAAEGLAFDSAGTLYSASPGGNSIQKFTSGGVPSVFANLASGLSTPEYLAFAPAQVAVPFALRLTAVEKLGTDLRLGFTSQAGTNYALQSRADLSSGSWATLPGTTNSGTGGTVQQTLTNALIQPRQFYRVQQLP